MELAAEHIATRHHARETARVVRMRRNVRSACIGVNRVGMREVHVRAFGKAAQKFACATVVGQMHLVPTHMGHLEARRFQTRTRAGKHAQTARPALGARLENLGGSKVRPHGIFRQSRRRIFGHALIAALEKQLQPQANAQKRSPLANGVKHRLGFARFLHERDGVVERSHARQHHGIGRANFIWRIARLRAGACAGKPTHHAR